MRSYRDFVSDLPRVPAIVAHRGAWHQAPENSLAAVLAAADAGYEIVEIDVQVSRDGVVFLLHDDTLDRMAGQGGLAEDLTMAELAALRLRAGDGRGASSPTEHAIPTLADVLEAARGRVYLDVDVKHARNMEAAAKVIADCGMQDQVDIKIPAHSPQDTARLAELERTHGVMVMPMTRFTAGTASELIALLATTGARIVETEFDDIETLRRYSGALAEAGLTVWINTLTPVANGGFTDAAAAHDPDAVWGALMRAGAGVFQTDLPEDLAAWRQTALVQS